MIDLPEKKQLTRIPFKNHFQKAASINQKAETQNKPKKKKSRKGRKVKKTQKKQKKKKHKKTKKGKKIKKKILGQIEPFPQPASTPSIIPPDS